MTAQEKTAADTPKPASKAKAKTAADTILLGQHGEINAGQEIPATYVDSLGETQHTDFDRLSELGLLA